MGFVPLREVGQGPRHGFDDQTASREQNPVTFPRSTESSSKDRRWDSQELAGAKMEWVSEILQFAVIIECSRPLCLESEPF
jgi:hypothetical protein